MYAREHKTGERLGLVERGEARLRCMSRMGLLMSTVPQSLSKSSVCNVSGSDDNRSGKSGGKVEEFSGSWVKVGLEDA